jgi:hypothetical protein
MKTLDINIMNYKDFYNYLKESTWQGWENINSVDKEELQNAINHYISYIKNSYSEELSRPKIMRLKKLIDAIDSTDPTDAAKILARFSMEEILSLTDFISYKFSDADKAISFLYNISAKHKQPIKISQPDIVLKDVAKYNNKNTSNIEIFGLQDHRPEVGFGIGKHRFDKDFIESTKNTNEFYIDAGQNWKIVNFQEVLEKIKDAINNYYNRHSNL